MRDQHYEIEVTVSLTMPWKQIYSWVGKKYTIYSKVIITIFKIICLLHLYPFLPHELGTYWDHKGYTDHMLFLHNTYSHEL